MSNREQLRITFNQDAALYNAARPGYPEQLFEDIIAFSGIRAQGRMLEIGSGTGQATVPFARCGYHIDGIELGANMAALARKNTAAYPGVQIFTGNFEDWALESAAYAIAFSAQAFHWIDPAIRYQKVVQALKPDGTIALFWNTHVHTPASQGFFEQVQPIYEKLFPQQSKTSALPSSDDLDEPEKAELERTGLFEDITVKRYRWEISYDTSSYIRLLSTYSDHRIQSEQTRERLFVAIADLIDTKFNGHITKGHLTMLYLAQRK